MVTVRGNKGLAEAIGVNVRTIQRWRREGVLDDAILSNFRRTIIYDLDKVYKCLNSHIARPGRPRKRFI